MLGIDAVPDGDDGVQVVDFHWFVRTGNVQILHIAFFNQFAEKAGYSSPNRINILSPQRIRLNKRPPWLNLIAHQRCKDIVSRNRILELHA